MIEESWVCGWETVKLGMRQSRIGFEVLIDGLESDRRAIAAIFLSM